MKKASQWIFGLMFAAALLLPTHICYAYEGESEEEWVNRIWYNTQWTVARARKEAQHLIGQSGTFFKVWRGDYTGYSDVMPWAGSGRIEFVWLGNNAPGYVEIMADGAAHSYMYIDGEWLPIMGFLNMAAGNNRRR